MSKKNAKSQEELLKEALLPVEEQPYQLPGNWVWVKLGSLIKIKSGDSLTKNQMIEGNIPVYGGNGVTGFHIESNINKPIVVVGRVGYYCGSVHLTPDQSWVTDNAFVVHFDNEQLDLKYLYWLLKQLNLGQFSNSSAQPVISGKTIYPVKTPLPPLNEQKRIVDKVERLLDKINQAKQLIEEAKESFELRRAAILDKAFRGDLLDSSNKLKTAFIITSSITLDVPLHWEVRPLKEVVENHSNKRVPITKDQRKSGTTPYYGATGVVDYVEGYTHDGNYVLIGEDGANLLSRSKPQAFQVNGQSWINNHAHVLKMKGNMSNDYLEYYLNFIPLNDFVTGTAQPKLNKKNLENILIVLPPIDEQVRISQKLDKLRINESEILRSLLLAEENLSSLLQSILSKAFRGELGTNDITDRNWFIDRE